MVRLQAALAYDEPWHARPGAMTQPRCRPAISPLTIGRTRHPPGLRGRIAPRSESDGGRSRRGLPRFGATSVVGAGHVRVGLAPQRRRIVGAEELDRPLPLEVG